ncbi:protein kinase [Actinomadura barringtoniae]|uniref:Protein kinase n=1 Tax=Actinomadura barringtoniae TaxID=1427535 RepID=A0A939PJJ7_9ACTN|nr:ABC transporter substrate-binding protein [Actinomadura barringtoniae]MBO2453911.1 protein kinase [Actinomadura barringtoniae]
MAVLPLRPGDPDRLSGYTLIGRLGVGGQGTVFLGEDDDGGRRVAIKLMHAAFTDDPRARSRFAAELAAARRVAPFCTAPILDSDVDGDAPYIVSEFVPGRPLSTVLREDGPRSGAALDRIAVGTITALAAIHQAGVVHRDFKPHNVMLAADGPRVIDFGIARALDATTVSGHAVGTPSYMAPEQISGDEVGPPADVFAWASTMVFAATGRPPFGNDTIPAVMHRILHIEPDLGGLEGRLRETVEQCLAKDPAGRPTSHQALIRLLDQSGPVPAPAVALNRGAVAAAENAPASPAKPEESDGGLTEPRDTTHPVARRKRIPRPVWAGGAALVALAVAAGAAAWVLWSGDGGGQDGPKKPAAVIGRTGGELTMALPVAGTDFRFDPAEARSGSERTVAEQLSTGPAELGTDGRVRPALATAIKPSAGCSAWELTLRRDTAFSDGTKVDAAAFVRGWNAAARVGNGPAATAMRDIKGYAEVAGGDRTTMSGVRAAGPGTVEVALSSPDCEFDKRLGDPVFAPVPKKDADRVGTGPFKIESYDKGKRLVLARNDRWALGQARLDRVIIDLDSSTTADTISAFQAGKYGFSPVGSGEEALARSRLPEGDRLLNRPIGAATYLIPITARGPLRTREARLAVSYALDRAELTDKAYNGLRAPAPGLVPSALPGWGTQASGGSAAACASCVRQNVAEARRLAKAGGLAPGTTLRLIVQGEMNAAHWAPLVQRQLDRVLGLKVVIESEESMAEWKAAMMAPDASGLGSSGYGAPYPTAYAFLHPTLGGDQIPSADGGGEGFNLSQWSNARFDATLARVPRATDEQTRLGLARQAEKIALDDMALIPLWNTRKTALADRSFVGLDLDFEGVPTLAGAALR